MYHEGEDYEIDGPESDKNPQVTLIGRVRRIENHGLPVASLQFTFGRQVEPSKKFFASAELEVT